MKIAGISLLAIVVTAALVVGLTAAGLAWRYVIAEPRGKVQQEEILQRGQNRIARYDHFFNLCAAVQSDEATIGALTQELATDPPVSRVTQINATITALRSGRAEKINQYNADARKSGTIAQFRSSDLPFQLVHTEEVTSCVAT
jgi:hypothetical protein